MPVAVSSYEFSVFLHVTAVMVGFGSTFAESVMFPVAMKLSPRHLPYVHRLQLTINRYFALPALLVVIVTGVYQMSEGNWDYGDFWVSGTMTIVVIIAVLLLAYFIPADKRLQPMVERELAGAGEGEVRLSDEYQRAARNEGIAGSITGILLVVAVFLMVAKPGL
jgi:amino acid permease